MKRYQALPTVSAVLLVAALGCSAPQPEPAAPAEGDGATSALLSTEPDPNSPLQAISPPIRGAATIQFTAPNARRQGTELVTTLKVKNPSATNSIAGFQVDDNWYDAQGNPVTGDSYRHRTPLAPGEVIDIELRTPVTPAMNRNQYLFKHANGDITPEQVPTL
ncbi:MAG: hypothetical protein HOP14_01440 [Acidobacteria bacterium]|nr:hypothetical protein [Acidobacteriota bacterium]